MMYKNEGRLSLNYYSDNPCFIYFKWSTDFTPHPLRSVHKIRKHGGLMKNNQMIISAT